MASLSKDGNGWRILFVCPSTKKRRTIRTGRCAKKNAETALNMVERLVEAKQLGTPVDRQTATWLDSIDGTLRDRLAKAGLAARQAEDGTQGVCLGLHRRPARREAGKQDGLAARRGQPVRLLWRRPHSPHDHHHRGRSLQAVAHQSEAGTLHRAKATPGRSHVLQRDGQARIHHQQSLQRREGSPGGRR